MSLFYNIYVCFCFYLFGQLGVMMSQVALS